MTAFALSKVDALGVHEPCVLLMLCSLVGRSLNPLMWFDDDCLN
ncbi:MAG: hypothetical protein MG2_1205 [uncultured Candidatus Poseidoniales archaeon]|nr:MAG: hypothetical protein MG2_1205 [uncultured Candidatus Poseidoniales archaeon]